MLRNQKDERKERNCRSQEKKRSMSREQEKQLKIDKIKLKFRSIVNKLRELKSDHHNDKHELNQLMKSSDRIQKMAHQSVEKAQLVLTDTHRQRRRATLPLVLEVKEIRPFELVSESPASDKDPKQTKQLYDIDLKAAETKENSETKQQVDIQQSNNIVADTNQNISNRDSQKNQISLSDKNSVSDRDEFDEVMKFGCQGPYDESEEVMEKIDKSSSSVTTEEQKPLEEQVQESFKTQREKEKVSERKKVNFVPLTMAVLLSMLIILLVIQ